VGMIVLVGGFIVPELMIVIVSVIVFALFCHFPILVLTLHTLCVLRASALKSDP
jgi:hypothetical protein